MLSLTLYQDLKLSAGVHQHPNGKYATQVHVNIGTGADCRAVGYIAITPSDARALAASLTAAADRADAMEAERLATRANEKAVEG